MILNSDNIKKIKEDPGSAYRNGKDTIRIFAEEIIPKLKPNEKDFLKHVKEFVTDPWSKLDLFPGINLLGDD